MKALKHESAGYVEQIVSAIRNCYENNPTPTNAELMGLYGLIGRAICEQGEKAFVVHLAQLLTEQLPQAKGFSPRNLRRMRDFYRAYGSRPELMRQALALGWTQNAVILDCCETDGQRAFYIRLASERNLSKLALMKAIVSGAFETEIAEAMAAGVSANACAAVSDFVGTETVDSAAAAETPCGAFMTACEPLRQGGSAAISRNPADNDEMPADRVCKTKRSLPAAHWRPLKLLKIWLRDIGKTSRQIWFARHWLAFPPPRWRFDFEMPEQSTGFA